MVSKIKVATSVVKKVVNGVKLITAKDSLILRAGQGLGEELIALSKQKSEEMKIKHETKMLEERIKQAELKSILREMGENVPEYTKDVNHFNRIDSDTDKTVLNLLKK